LEIEMKNWFVAVILIMCACGLTIGQSNPSSNNAEDEIRKLEQQWIDAAARPDLRVLGKIIADNFMGTAFGPGVLTKDDIVPPDGSTQNHMPKCSLVDPTVQVFGDTAVLMGNLQPEDPKAGGFRVTTVFQKQAQGWQIIAIHMSQAGPK
jgi:ketosteroid isomerase-like protein